MNAVDCVPREELKEYLAGWSAPELSERIEAHLAQCQSCEQTVISLEADPDTFMDVLCELQPPQGPDSEIDSILSRVRQSIDGSLEDASTRDDESSLGDFGAYELQRPLGRGGMGSVYLARHRQLGKLVAIKLLPTRVFRGEHLAARFQREIRAAGGLEHPAIVGATDAGEHDGTQYLVMEFIDGLDLSRIARASGEFSIADACAVLQTVALGLAHAHAASVVHRDIKPSNLMLSSSGQAKILDFGLSRHNLWDEASAELTTVGQLMGTLDYMAPEQAERPEAVDYRADLYSLGATLFRLLCGRPPLAAAPDLSPLAKLRLLATHESPSLDTLRPDAPSELVKLVKSLLARDPAERPASAAHVAEQLRPFTDGADLVALVARAQALAVEQPADLPSPIASSSPKLPAQQASKSDGGNHPRWRWLMMAAVAPLIVFAGVLIALEMQKGQLVIESDAANVAVRLLRDGEFYRELRIEPGVNTTMLYAGRYRVEIDSGSDAVVVDGTEFTIQKGETTIARLRTTEAALEAPGIELTYSARTQALEPNATQSQQLLYQGKNLDAWLEVIASDRSPVALGEAFAAVRALVVPEAHEQISESLLRSLPRLDGSMPLKLPSGEEYQDVDYRGFELLSVVNPGDEYYRMLVRQLVKSTDMAWNERMLSATVTRRANSDTQALTDWLKPNVFEAPQRHALQDAATALYYWILVRGSNLDSNLAQRMLATLEDCQYLGREFWLTQQLPASEGNLALGTNDMNVEAWSETVSAHALAAFADSETEAKYVIQSAMILGSVRHSLPELIGEDGVAKLHAALRLRLAQLADDEDTLYSMVELDAPIGPSEFDQISSWPTGFTAKIQRNGYYASMTLELLRLVDHRDVELESELRAIFDATSSPVREVYLSLEKENPYRASSRRTVTLSWPGLDIVGGNLLLSKPVTQRQWLASFIWWRLQFLLPVKTMESMAAEALQATKRAWTEAVYAAHDANHDGQMDSVELSKLGGAIQANLPLVSVDQDHDELASLEEVLDFLENEPLALVDAGVTEWSKRQIARYDSNEDGELTKDEWDRMFVKPIGADANGDGVITVAEYAAFRAGSK